MNTRTIQDIVHQHNDFTRQFFNTSNFLKDNDLQSRAVQDKDKENELLSTQERSKSSRQEVSKNNQHNHWRQEYSAKNRPRHS